MSTRTDTEPLSFAERVVCAQTVILMDIEQEDRDWETQDVLEAAIEWTTSDRLGDWDDYQALRNLLLDMMSYRAERAIERGALPWE